MIIFVWILILGLSLIILTKSSDYFVETSKKIGQALEMPRFIVGVTIVAVGTSLPELTSSVIAVFKNAPEIVIGNVLGSNITNIFLILGISAILAKKIKLNYELIKVDLPFFIGSAFFLFLALIDKKFSYFEALVSLLGLIFYFLYLKSSLKKEKIQKKEKIHLVEVLILIISCLLIYFSAQYCVEAVIKISTILKIGTEILASTIVALGTSLPELFVTISAAKKSQGEIALGNILGSNIFNSFGVMSIATFFHPLKASFPDFNFLLIIFLFASLLYFFITCDKKITFFEGALLIIFYLFYLAKLYFKFL